MRLDYIVSKSKHLKKAAYMYTLHFPNLMEELSEQLLRWLEWLK